MTVFAAALIGLAVVIGGCAVVLGSGRAEIKVDRKVEVASGNEADVKADVESNKENRK